MTDIAKAMRPWLTERFIVGRPTVREAQVSNDGTRKWLLAAADGQAYDMVFIPDADRGTICVSSQVACTPDCRFCHTDSMRPHRRQHAGCIVVPVHWPHHGNGKVV